MADVTFYVNSATGDDGNAGSENAPLKTISAVFAKAAFTGRGTGNVTILLAGTSAEPLTYTEVSGGNNVALDLATLFTGGGNLYLQPKDWNQGRYDARTADPCDAGASFDPARGKPCVIPSVTITPSIFLRGVSVRPASSSIRWGIMAQSGSNGSNGDTQIAYCRVEGHDVGFISPNMGNGSNQFMDCCFAANRVGVLLQMLSMGMFVGRNVFVDNTEHAIQARVLSMVMISTNDGPPMEIRTTTPRDAYAAIKLEFSASLFLNLDLYGMGGTPFVTEIRGFLKIINASGVDNGDYVGVLLETQSKAVGCDNVFFYESGLIGGAPTVPAARQFVQREGHATVVVP
jgi:hypothetical protein